MSKTTRYGFVFFCCLLAIPTCVYGFGLLYAEEPYFAVAAGALLGCAHLVLRPLLRFVTRPIGCLTFGLSTFAIDVGLIYGCAYFLDGFAVPKLLDAVLAAILVNAACWIVWRRQGQNHGGDGHGAAGAGRRPARVRLPVFEGRGERRSRGASAF